MHGWLMRTFAVAGGATILLAFVYVVFWFTTDWQETTEDVEIDGLMTSCQVRRKWPIVTYMPGLTLPSGNYLRHPPQYFPPSPPFPLPVAGKGAEIDGEDGDW